LSTLPESPSAENLGAVLRARGATRLLRSLVVRQLDKLTTGRIILKEGVESRRLGRPDEQELRCELTVHDPRFYADVVLGGSIGAAEAYMAGYWSVDDLTTLIRILARDTCLNGQIDGGLARVKLLLLRVWYRLRDNTRSGSRRNIAGHYDLGNAFFESFLDPTMTYSCGIFETPSASLEQASILKNDLICRKLSLGPGEEVLEIGTGWGEWAVHAARHYGCRVVTTTISRNQHEYAVRRVRDAGLEDRIVLLREDYRDLSRRLGRRFDKLVSVEMVEAVGHQHLEDYFRACADLLKPEGSMLLQSITIADQQYEAYRRSVDFIQRYIFPGGCVPSLTALCRAMTRASDLRVAHLQDITTHYATTLCRWRENFRASRRRIDELGFPEEFRRMWEFYLCYSEGGFLERAIGDVQLLLTRPLAGVPDRVPQT